MLEKIKSCLSGNDISILSQKEINHGAQLSLDNGAKINIFNSGKFNVQGKEKVKKEVETCLECISPESRKKSNLSKDIFVVYGHDRNARSALDSMLRRWGFNPLILDSLPSEGATIIEKLEKTIDLVGFGIVLATPDDVGYEKGHETEATGRVRQNVVLELGMLLSKLGRKRVAILLKSSGEMERPSDIQGLMYIPFKDDLQHDAGKLLAKEMAAQGYLIDIQNL